MNNVLRQIYSVNGGAVELNNCLEEAGDVRRELNGRNGAAIKTALDAGKFCVVEEHAHYCRSTDAFAGTVRSLAFAGATREEAEAFIAANGDRYADGETGVIILPFTPADRADIGKSEKEVLDEVPF